MVLYIRNPYTPTYHYKLKTTWIFIIRRQTFMARFNTHSVWPSRYRPLNLPGDWPVSRPFFDKTTCRLIFTRLFGCSIIFNVPVSSRLSTRFIRWGPHLSHKFAKVPQSLCYCRSWRYRTNVSHTVSDVVLSPKQENSRAAWIKWTQAGRKRFCFFFF